MIKYYLMNNVGDVNEVSREYLNCLNADTPSAAAYLEYCGGVSEKFYGIICAYYYCLLQDAYKHHNVDNLEDLKAAAKAEGLPVSWIEWVESEGELSLWDNKRKYMTKGRAETIIRAVFRQCYSLIKEDTESHEVTFAIRSVGYDQRYNICKAVKEHFSDCRKVEIKHSTLRSVGCLRSFSPEVLESWLEDHQLNYSSSEIGYTLHKQLLDHFSQPFDVDRMFTDFGYSTQSVVSALNLLRSLEADRVNIDCGKQVC